MGAVPFSGIRASRHAVNLAVPGGSRRPVPRPFLTGSGHLRGCVVTVMLPDVSDQIEGLVAAGEEAVSAEAADSSAQSPPALTSYEPRSSSCGPNSRASRKQSAPGCGHQI
jgi:hypothetical protein